MIIVIIHQSNQMDEIMSGCIYKQRSCVGPEITFSFSHLLQSHPSTFNEDDDDCDNEYYGIPA